MLSIVLPCIRIIACAGHMLTMVVAMGGRVGRGADGRVVKIAPIHAGHMLTILNVKKIVSICSKHVRIMPGILWDALGVGGSYELMLYVEESKQSLFGDMRRPCLARSGIAPANHVLTAYPEARSRTFRAHAHVMQIKFFTGSVSELV